jgi:hypothetical protein
MSKFSYAMVLKKTHSNVFMSTSYKWIVYALFVCASTLAALSFLSAPPAFYYALLTGDWGQPTVADFDDNPESFPHLLQLPK